MVTNLRFNIGEITVKVPKKIFSKISCYKSFYRKSNAEFKSEKHLKNEN